MSSLVGIMHVSNLHINHVKVILPVWDRLDMSTHTHTQSTNHTVVSGTCSQTYWTNDRYTMHVVILSQTAGFIIKTIPSQIQVHIHKQFPSMTRWLKRRKKWNKRKTFVFFCYWSETAIVSIWNRHSDAASLQQHPKAYAVETERKRQRLRWQHKEKGGEIEKLTWLDEMLFEAHKKG